VRWLLREQVTQLPLVWRAATGAAAGGLTKWGSIHGYYHCVMFPLILLEMERGGFALLGALDVCCLCCVCAGVCAAVGLTSRAPAEAAASRRAALINLGLGDYVEACYPWMAKSAVINAAAYCGAALAGAALLVVDGSSSGPAAAPLSSAYLPLPVAVAVSPQPAPVAVAAALAFTVPFSATLLYAAVRA
jgi:hypothetical protein